MRRILLAVLAVFVAVTFVLAYPSDDNELTVTTKPKTLHRKDTKMWGIGYPYIQEVLVCAADADSVYYPYHTDRSGTVTNFQAVYSRISCLAGSMKIDITSESLVGDSTTVHLEAPGGTGPTSLENRCLLTKITVSSTSGSESSFLWVTY